MFVASSRRAYVLIATSINGATNNEHE